MGLYGRFVLPKAIEDAALECEVRRCVAAARETTARLVALLAEVGTRRLHLAAGCSSLFTYCTEVLNLSEHEAYNRIEAARAARAFPLVLERLQEGSVNLTTVRLLAPHLTGENHRELLASASGLRKRKVEELLARRFPRPDVAAAIRRLPPPRVAGAGAAESGAEAGRAETGHAAAVPATEQMTQVVAVPAGEPARAARPSPALPVPAPRASVAPLSEERYAFRCTISAATRAKLEEAQELLRHAIPGGDVAEILDRALAVLVDQIKRKRIGATERPARSARPAAHGSRHVPAAVRRSTWAAQEGRCGFVGRDGRRCTARGFIQSHHVHPWGAGGEGVAGNIEPRCRAHNEYESRLYYGPIRDAAERSP